MKEKLVGFLKVLVPFSLFLLGLQFAMINYVLEVAVYYSSFAIYIFHFIATFLIYLFLVYIHFNFSNKTGFAFMGLSLLKMMAAVIFLLPMIVSGTATAFAGIMAFFVPYFLFLGLETFFAVKLINS